MLNQCFTNQDENISNTQMNLFRFPPDFGTFAPPVFMSSYVVDTYNNNNNIPKQDHHHLKVSHLGSDVPQLPLQRSIPSANFWAYGEEMKSESMSNNNIMRRSFMRDEDEKYEEHIDVSSSTTTTMKNIKKKIIKSAASGRRKMREPRFSFKTMSDVDVLDDGYKWRKYGQKVVKDTYHPRSYYRCTQENCRVKKRVERLAEDPRMVITTYEGRHMHSPNPNDNNNNNDLEF